MQLKLLLMGNLLMDTLLSLRHQKIQFLFLICAFSIPGKTVSKPVWLVQEHNVLSHVTESMETM